MLGSSYPFADVMWTMLVFFLWILWFWILFTVWVDIFRRSDISGWGKAGWLVFTIILPFLGVFIYLITQNEGINQRNVERAQAQKAQFDDYVRSAAVPAGGGSAASEISEAKKLLDSGALTQAEFDALKQKALAQA